MKIQKKKDFILFRLVKKIFFTGLANILPTILVISVLVIAYNFLTNNIGRPVNVLLKKQLSGNWKKFSINYLGINEELFKPVYHETYEQMMARVQNQSVKYKIAKEEYKRVQKEYDDAIRDKIKKREKATDQDYINFLDSEIAKIESSSGLDEAKKKLQNELVKLQEGISRENQIRLEKIKWEQDRKERLINEINRKYPDIIGLLIAFFIIFLIGMIITTVAGRSINRFWERAIANLPLIRKIYPYTKQLTDFLFQSNTAFTNFKRVVLIEYPRKGIYTLGFRTGEGIVTRKEFSNVKSLVSVFIPSSPTPVTGYTIMVEEDDIIPLNITVEQAIRYTVTGGVVNPRLLASEDEDEKETEEK